MDAAPTKSIRSKTSRLMNVCGEQVSRNATQQKGVRASAPPWIAILVVKEASSRVMVPSTRQGACSDSATPGATAKTSGLWSADASEKQVENYKGGPEQAWATAKGQGDAGESS